MIQRNGWFHVVPLKQRQGSQIIQVMDPPNRFCKLQIAYQDLWMSLWPLRNDMAQLAQTTMDILMKFIALIISLPESARVVFDPIPINNALVVKIDTPVTGIPSMIMTCC